MLTDSQIRSIKTPQKPVKLFDAGGLYLLVNPNGSRYWRLKYRFGGRERGISMGVYPETPLKLARERRDLARRMLAEGVNPSWNRRDLKTPRAVSRLTWGDLRAYARKQRISDDTPILCQIPESLEGWKRIPYRFRVGGEIKQWSALPPFQPYRVEIDGHPVMVIEIDY